MNYKKLLAAMAICLAVLSDANCANADGSSPINDIWNFATNNNVDNIAGGLFDVATECASGNPILCGSGGFQAVASGASAADPQSSTLTGVSQTGQLGGGVISMAAGCGTLAAAGAAGTVELGPFALLGAAVGCGMGAYSAYSGASQNPLLDGGPHQTVMDGASSQDIYDSCLKGTIPQTVTPAFLQGSIAACDKLMPSVNKAAGCTIMPGAPGCGDTPSTAPPANQQASNQGGSGKQQCDNASDTNKMEGGCTCPNNSSQTIAVGEKISDCKSNNASTDQQAAMIASISGAAKIDKPTEDAFGMNAPQNANGTIGNTPLQDPASMSSLYH